MKIILLCGYKRSGKDTVADYLEQVIPEEYLLLRTSFAHQLKRLCAIQFGIHRSFFDYEKDTPLKIIGGKTKTPRDLCRLVGKEIRDKNPNHWVELVLDEIDSFEQLGRNQLVIITDGRYNNELDVIEKYVGKEEFIATWVDRGLKSDGHESESSLDYERCTIKLDNIGTISQLHREIEHKILPWILSDLKDKISNQNGCLPG